ncbi:MAG: ComF family protein [Candidatus Omnitrophota bacterium]|jgi:ComF family protein
MFKKALKTFTDIVLPNLCFVCDEKITSGHLCKKCLEKIEFILPPLCKLCSRAFSPKKKPICGKCKSANLPYEQLICITAYKEPIASLIHLFKYGNYSYLSDTLSVLMIQHLIRIGLDLSKYDIITPVPMHKAKLRERGYNQSELLAKIIAKHFNISLRNDIISVKSIRPQQAKLSGRDRKENLKNLFEVKENMEGKSVILIDDIFTTGQTVKECSYALKNKGARITVLTLAKTQ